jgi:phenylacetate-CoA ligase
MAPLKSAVDGIGFPAVPGAKASQAAAVQFQLERSQWLAPDALRELQQAQARRLLEHAMRTVPYYRALFRGAGVGAAAGLDAAHFARLPISRRAMVSEAGEALRSTAVPKAHGREHPVTTSGTTGTPVRLRGTDLTAFMWRAFTLREHLWQGRDFSAKLAAIRWAKKDFAAAPHGERWAGWGDAVELLYESGPAAMLNVITPLAGQAAWLAAERPRYLVSFPSNLAALAEYCAERKLELPGLAEVRTVGEVLTVQQRALFARVWGCKVTDMYTCEEAGYLALQCPEAPQHYHVQAENVLLEVVDDAGAACAPGEAGHVLITTLHNFATPLIRYELGDIVELGGACPCGRGLPVVKGIRGRRRNRLRLPDGRSEFPYLGEHGQIAAASGVRVRQFQFVQRSVEEVEVKLVTDREFTADEAERVRRVVQSNLGYPFRITLTRCAEIPKGPGGKYQEFVSEA